MFYSNRPLRTAGFGEPTKLFTFKKDTFRVNFPFCHQKSVLESVSVESGAEEVCDSLSLKNNE